MNFRCGSGKKSGLGSKINFKTNNKEKIKIFFCKTILLAVRRQSVKTTSSNKNNLQFVMMYLSEMGDIVCGVPKGSKLGSLLFLVYMNDMSKAVTDCCIKLFPDDTNLFISGTSLLEVEVKANDCLNKIHDWFVANKLSLNIHKTCYTLFATSSKNRVLTDFNLFINKVKIYKVASCKYLGVNIDYLFTWTVHIDCVYKKLIKFSGIFYKLREIFPTSCLRKLYFSFVQPHIAYGIEVYANTNAAVLDKLHKLNNKLLRILQGEKLHTPVSQLYTQYNVLPISLLHEMKILTIVHKYVYHKRLLSDVYRSYFTESSLIHLHNTRKKQDFHFLNASSVFGKRCTAFHGSMLWSSLPDDIKLCSFLLLFSIMVKKHFMSKLVK